MPKLPKKPVGRRRSARRIRQPKVLPRARQISASSRRAILVLGMHRSGTSAVTRMLNLLGADLPKNILSENAFNERGTWESDDIVATNNSILSAIGSSWDDWRLLHSDWFRSAECEAYKQQLLDVLGSNFSDSRLFVIKDSRICRLVPLWLDVLKRFGADVTAVIPVRNPLEVAASLKARDGLAPAKSHLLWLRHMRDVEKETRSISRAIVTYEDVLNAWRDVAATVSARIGIPWPRRSPIAEIEIERFIELRLHHFIAEPGQLTTRADISNWVKSAYAALIQMSRHGENSASRQQLDRIGDEFDNASLMFGAASAETEANLMQRDTEIARLSEDVAVGRSLAEERGAIAARLADDLAATRVLLEERAAANAQVAGELSAARTAVGEKADMAARLANELSEIQNVVEQKIATAVRLEEELAALRAASEERGATAAKLADELASVRAAAEERGMAAARLEEELARVRADSEERGSVAARLAEELATVRIAAADVSAAGAQLAEELAAIRTRVKQREAENARLSEELTAARTNFEGQQSLSIAELDAVRAVAEARERELRQTTREVESIRVFLRDSQAQTQRLSGELDQAREELSQATSEVARKSFELAKTTSELSQAKIVLAVNHERLSVANENAVQSQTELARMREELSSAQDALSSLQNALLVNQNTIEQLASELKPRQVELENILDRNAALEAQLKSAKLSLSQSDDELHAMRRTQNIERELNADLRQTIVAQASAMDQAQESVWWRATAFMRGMSKRLSPLKTRDVGMKSWEADAIAKSKLFNAVWYLEQNPDVVETGQDPLEHYLLHGAKEGRDPHPLFDHEWYLSRYPDVAKAKMSPLVHYVTVGASEGLDPHPLFDTSWYLQQYPDVAASHQNPLFHYMKYGGIEGRNPHPLFDSTWYLSKNADVAAARENPLYHYLMHGAAEGRDPHPLFNTGWYVSQYPEVAASGQNPLTHYFMVGAARGYSPSPLFDGAWYLERNSDVAAVKENPLVHFITDGAKQRRDPHPLFDTAWYRDNNPEAANSPDGPFAHYISVGGFEGRDPHPLFDSDWYLENNPDAKAAGINPLEHYLLHGNEAGRDPHPLFRRAAIESKYGISFPDNVSPLVCFLKMSQERDIDPCALFDSRLYRYQVEVERHRALDDVPIIDYLKTGYKDKLVLPNIIFDPKTYLETNNIEVVGPELVHYALEGDRMGYFTHPHFCAAVYNANRNGPVKTTAIEHFFTSAAADRPISHQQMTRALPEELLAFIRRVAETADFDEEIYLELYPDLREEPDPRYHFETHGRAEGRAGSARQYVQQMGFQIRDIPLGFYWEEYLNLNVDLKTGIYSGFGPLFLHYLKNGRNENRMIGNWQLYIDVQKYCISRPPSPLTFIPTQKKGGVCVLMHIFHTDLFRELVTYAQSFGELLSDLCINVANSAWSVPFHREIREYCAGAFTMVSANTGRDIGGFLRLLGSIDIQSYELFAWMHTKKSPHIAPEKGEYWRRKLLNAFAGSQEIAEQCVRLFSEDPEIGIVACKEWRALDIGNNAVQYNKLLERFEIDQEHREVEYVSGTMFIIRADIVQKFYDVMKDVQFESGDGTSLEFNIDGQIAHAAERVIGNVVRQLGYRIEWVEA